MEKKKGIENNFSIGSKNARRNPLLSVQNSAVPDSREGEKEKKGENFMSGRMSLQKTPALGSPFPPLLSLPFFYVLRSINHPISKKTKNFLSFVIIVLVVLACYVSSLMVTFTKPWSLPRRRRSCCRYSVQCLGWAKPKSWLHCSDPALPFP